MNREFTVHHLNELGIQKARDIADAFNTLLESLKYKCVDSREFSICRTKLEEACFFAKKSMANELINTDDLGHES